MPHKRIIPKDKRHADMLRYKYAWEQRNKDKPEYKEKRRARQRAWTAKNPTYRKEWRARVRQAALDLLGNRCSSPDCSWVNTDGSVGCTDERCLQIDHINGGGHRESLLLGWGDKFYQKVVDTNGTGYQLLCANCNWIKRHENKEWPALKEREVAA